MSVRFSRNLTDRMVLRGVPKGLPETIYREADRYLLDTQTGVLEAVKRCFFQGRDRDMALSYTRSGEDVLLVTLHPLKEDQVERRLRSGRWVPYESEGAL